MTTRLQRRCANRILLLAAVCRTLTEFGRPPKVSYHAAPWKGLARPSLPPNASPIEKFRHGLHAEVRDMDNSAGLHSHLIPGSPGITTHGLHLIKDNGLSPHSTSKFTGVSVRKILTSRYGSQGDRVINPRSKAARRFNADGKGVVWPGPDADVAPPGQIIASIKPYRRRG